MATNLTVVTSVRLKVYAARAKATDHTVLQYNRDTDQLRVWEWPSTTEARIPPSELRNYRCSHCMLGPCCLCPLKDPNAPDFVEAAIYRVRSRDLSGEYVASCARDKCGYFVFMERLYSKVGLPIKNYPRRELGERIPPQVTHPSELEQIRRLPLRTCPPRPLKRSFAMLDIEARPARTRQKTVVELLEQLDARVQPGITDTEFSALFHQCECGMVTTRRAFSDHKCIVDLSGDD